MSKSGPKNPAPPNTPHSPSTLALPDLQDFAGQAIGRDLAPGVPMAGGGSARAFFRFSATGAGAESWIGVIGSNAAETRAFLGFTRHFAAQGLPVPSIIAADEARGFYLMEDLGKETLADQLAAWRAVPIGRVMAMAALNRVVGWLPRFQVHGGAGLDWRLCHERAELDGPVFEADLERFLWLYIPRHAPAAKPGDDVLAEMDALVLRLETVPREHFCYRDFQARNIMWRDGPVFLDYQSGRRGALHYDLASLLYSPDSGLGEAERSQLIDVYLQGLKDCGVSINRLAFLADFHPFVLVRRLQALGAYGQMAAQGKAEYLKKIPPALADLKQLLASGKLSMGLPKLEAWLRKVVDTPPQAGKTAAAKPPTGKGG